MKILDGKMFAPVALFFVFIFAAEAFAEAGAQGQSSPIGAIAPFALLFVLFYFLILRPQQKRNRQRQQMLKELKRGDSVITNGGIYATITEMGSSENDPITLEIAKGVMVKATLSSVASKAEEKAGE